MEREKKPLLILTGPTAVGKTELSIELAKAIKGEIISADSIQVYQYMDIGSAKVTKEQRKEIPHFLVDELKPEEEFNVTVFQKKAQQYIKEIYQRGHIPIIVGGTGFYIQSILYEIDFEETQKDEAYRKELEEFAFQNGTAALHRELEKIDAAAAKEIHANNIKRVIRALEYYKETGNKISEHNNIQRQKKSPYQFLYFVLIKERTVLYEQINQRVDEMIQKGLVEEVKSLLEKGYSRNLVSMQGIGYKEIASYLDGEISFENAVYLIKKETRHFAKRQITWFKREKEVTWIPVLKYQTKEELLNILIKKCKKEGMIKSEE